MTNYEWLIKEKPDFVKGLITHGGKLAIINGEPKRCASTSCSNCEFAKSLCVDARMAWLEAEHNPYTIPLDTPIDTKVLVSHNGTDWWKRHFAGFNKNNKYHYLAYDQGKTSWSGDETIDWEYCRLAEEGEQNERKAD